jgi:hypothetical protein
MADRTTYRCNGHYDGCTAAFDPPDADRTGGMKTIEAAARRAGWRTWRARLYGVETMAVFTCPACVAKEATR